MSEYDEAIRLDPKNGMAYCGRGAASTAKAEFDKAIASFDEAIRLDPKIASLSFYKRNRTAADSLRPNARNSTFAGEAERGSESLHPNARNSTFAEAAKRGSDAFERGDYDQAIGAWDEAIRIDPNHSEAHRWRGDASLNKRELDKALSEYDEAIRLDPTNGMAYCTRGAASIGKGEFDKAIACFDEAIRLDPKIANLSSYKRYRTAAESLRPSARKSTFAEEAKRGSDAFERGDFDQAIVAWDEAIRIDPNHSEVHRWRGDASLNKGEFDKALSEYDEAIRLDPKNGMAYCCRGAASTGKGEFDKAIASFDEAIRLDPEIANLSFYKRYRTAAEFPWRLGLLVVVPLLIFGLCLFLAFAVWPTLRHREPEADNDF